MLIDAVQDEIKPNENWIAGEEWIDIRDGQSYTTGQIGSQVWMTENLNFVTDSGCYVYDNNPSNATIYGRLYNRVTACIICPEGWHLPNDDEWKELEMFLGMSQAASDSTSWRGVGIGGKMKDHGTIYWNSPNTDATNSSGFTALPGGMPDPFGNFMHMGEYAVFWTASEDDITYKWYRNLRYNSSEVRRAYDFRNNGFSVCCVKD
jgi:uncharacterized protein (TIGR02145 family)